MVDYEAGRKCKQCGEVLRVDEFRYKNKRKDGRHLICLDCEPDGGFSTVLLKDELIPPPRKKGDSIIHNNKIVYRVDDESLIVEHFLMLASSCQDIAIQIDEIAGTTKSKTRTNAKLAATKIGEAIKLLS